MFLILILLVRIIYSDINICSINISRPFLVKDLTIKTWKNTLSNNYYSFNKEAENIIWNVPLYIETVDNDTIKYVITENVLMDFQILWTKFKSEIFIEVFGEKYDIQELCGTHNYTEFLFSQSISQKQICVSMRNFYDSLIDQQTRKANFRITQAWKTPIEIREIGENKSTNNRFYIQTELWPIGIKYFNNFLIKTQNARPRKPLKIALLLVLEHCGNQNDMHTRQKYHRIDNYINERKMCRLIRVSGYYNIMWPIGLQWCFVRNLYVDVQKSFYSNEMTVSELRYVNHELHIGSTIFGEAIKITVFDTTQLEHFHNHPYIISYIEPFDISLAQTNYCTLKLINKQSLEESELNLTVAYHQNIRISVNTTHVNAGLHATYVGYLLKYVICGGNVNIVKPSRVHVYIERTLKYC